MPSATVLLFVYGSLKRGGRHHEELAGAQFLGPAETEPGYRLEALAGTEYLALVRNPSDAVPSTPSTVAGELFLVEASRLPALDAFEGDAYCRAQLKITSFAELKIGKGLFALAYLKNAD